MSFIPWVTAICSELNNDTFILIIIFDLDCRYKASLTMNLFRERNAAKKIGFYFRKSDQNFSFFCLPSIYFHWFRFTLVDVSNWIIFWTLSRCFVYMEDVNMLLPYCAIQIFQRRGFSCDIGDLVLRRKQKKKNHLLFISIFPFYVKVSSFLKFSNKRFFAQISVGNLKIKQRKKKSEKQFRHKRRSF